MIDISNPLDWAEATQAFKNTFDIFRSAIGLARDAQNSPNATITQKEAVEKTLMQAEKAAKIAEVQIAKLLGYELCHCQFPPTAMLTVGRGNGRGLPHSDKQIYECPKCGFNTAGGWGYTRIAPPFIKEEA